MMPGKFDVLQRSNIKLADERDELRDMIATLEQEARQMRARNERLEGEVAGCVRVLREVVNPNLGAVGKIAPWLETEVRNLINNITGETK